MTSDDFLQNSNRLAMTKHYPWGRIPIIGATDCMNTKSSGECFDHRIHLNGVHAFVCSVRDGGRNITVSGWDSAHWKYEKDQLFLLEQGNGEETRYRATEVRHCGDPADMYFMELEFSPRQQQ